MISFRWWISMIVAMCFAGATAPSHGEGDHSSLAKPANPYGPPFSQSIPHANAEQAGSSDFVETFRVPDGSQVRVLVKVPAPAEPAKILRIASIAAGETANAYFAGAISEAAAGGYGTVVSPKGVYNFAAPAPGASHWPIKAAHDLRSTAKARRSISLRRCAGA